MADAFQKPFIVEVALNGARTRDINRHVPLSDDEIVASADACVRLGASILHIHAGLPVVGSAGHHDPHAYLKVFRKILDIHPRVLIYPTLPGGGVGTTMKHRLAHTVPLVDEGLLGFVPVDPGSMNYGAIDIKGYPPKHAAVYQTTYADVAWAIEYARKVNLPCTMSVFEPGFVRLAEAYRKAGMLPDKSIVKLEFSAGQRLFGLKPTSEGLDAWQQLFDHTLIPWMVTLRDGDLSEGFGELALKRGGHVRVGIEDYGGTRQPRNEDLVAEIADIGRSVGRRPAKPDEIMSLLKQKNSSSFDE